MKFKVGDRIVVSQTLSNHTGGGWLHKGDKGVVIPNTYPSDSPNSEFAYIIFDKRKSYGWYIKPEFLDFETRKLHSHHLTDIFKS